MDLWEAMRARHSVRRYTDRAVEPEQAEALRAAVAEINAETGFRFALCLDEPEAFQGNRPRYGSFAGCRNYLALVAPRGEDERVGYFGEKLVLLCQQLGLNTCWAALTFEKAKVAAPVGEGERLHDLVALGFGETQGVPHKSKPAGKVARLSADDPEWFRDGVEAALLAPTAINQQRFRLERVGERGVRAKALLGPCSKTDLGIVKYHFELGAGKDRFDWV